MENCFKMSDVQNLNAHYSQNISTPMPKKVVVSPPQTLPSQHLYNDIDANKRLKAINNDIYQDANKEKKKSVCGYFKFLAGFLATILTVSVIKKFFKKS